MIVLTGTTFLLAWIWGDPRLVFNQMILVLALTIETAELIRFVNHTNRELSRFLLAIRFNDFSATYKETSLGSSFRDLQESMRIIMDTYKEVKIEKEAQFRLLENLVEQIQVGIISLVDGEIVLVNATAQHLLRLEGVKNWRLMEQLRPAFTSEVKSLGTGGRRLVEMPYEQETKMLAVELSSRIILNKETKLITIQDINSEIEQKEIEAWHKLIRILTHEIMNSITPISSLTETMQSLLMDPGGQPRSLERLKEETISDLIFSLNTIHNRSEGLLRFVEDYRRLTRVPRPNPVFISLNEFLAHIQNLMTGTLQRQGITFEIDSPADRQIKIDPALMEQVLINLITNSMNALEESAGKAIRLKAYQNEGNLNLEISDTGKGIPENELKDIFVPFFSTRKNGSGIGLSLSKQIISQHGGSIKVTSTLGLGTKVTITLINQFH